MTTYAKQIAKAAIEVAANEIQTKTAYDFGCKSVLSVAAQAIRSLDPAAIVASVPNHVLDAGKMVGEQCGCCGGTGRMVRDPDIGTDQECFACDGSGRVESERDALTQAPQGFDAEFLSKRLARVAKLVGYPMPDMTHEQISEVAGTILGAIAGILERSQAPQRVELTDAERYRAIRKVATEGADMLMDQVQEIVYRVFPDDDDRRPTAEEIDAVVDGIRALLSANQGEK